MTSLHYHFPWLIKANLRWSIFCAATGRKMRQNLDWEPFYAIADRDLGPRERLRSTPGSRTSASRPSGSATSAAPSSAISTRSPTSSSARRRMRDAVRQKVTALFPAHEIDEFTELFWSRVQLLARAGGRAR